MEITLQYTSTRGEVPHWYWRMWRKRLWKIHAGVFAMVLFITIGRDGNWPPHDYHVLMYGLLVASGIVLLLIYFPQLMFKSQLRTLTVNDEGIQTTIGRRSGKRKWPEIGSIEDTPEDIIIINRKTYNAFLVPTRAFQNEKDRNTFLSTIRMRQSKAAPQ